MSKIIIDTQDIACTIAESLKLQMFAKLPRGMTSDSGFDNAVTDIARNVAQAVILCGDELPTPNQPTGDELPMQKLETALDAWVSRGVQGDVYFTRAGIASTSVEVTIGGHDRKAAIDKLDVKLRKYLKDCQQLRAQVHVWDNEKS